MPRTGALRGATGAVGFLQDLQGRKTVKNPSENSLLSFLRSSNAQYQAHLCHGNFFRKPSPGKAYNKSQVQLNLCGPWTAKAFRSLFLRGSFSVSILFAFSFRAELSLLLVLSVEWPRRLYGARCSALASVALSSRLGRGYL